MLLGHILDLLKLDRSYRFVHSRFSFLSIPLMLLCVWWTEPPNPLVRRRGAEGNKKRHTLATATLLGVLVLLTVGISKPSLFQPKHLAKFPYPSSKTVGAARIIRGGPRHFTFIFYALELVFSTCPISSPSSPNLPPCASLCSSAKRL